MGGKEKVKRVSVLDNCYVKEKTVERRCWRLVRQLLFWGNEVGSAVAR